MLLLRLAQRGGYSQRFLRRGGPARRGANHGTFAIPLQHPMSNIIRRIEAAHFRATGPRYSSGVTTIEKCKEGSFVRKLRIKSLHPRFSLTKNQ